MRDSLRHWFRKDGFEVLAADNAAEALQLLRDRTVDVALVDIRMPGMNGLELLEHSKRRWAKLPVMMITAYGDADNRDQARSLGADDFLTKPIDFAYLKARLEAVLENVDG